MGDLMKRSMEEWAALAQEAWTQSGRFDADMLKKAFDPAEWRRAGTRFDMGLEKLTEGPTYATLFDLDRKILNAQKLWIDRTRDIEHYYEVVQGAWNRAYERFMKSIGEKDGAPIKSGRAAARPLARHRQHGAGGDAPLQGFPRRPAPHDALVHRLPPRRAGDRRGVLRDAPHSHAHRDGRDAARGDRAQARGARAAARGAAGAARPPPQAPRASGAKKRRKE